MLQIVEQSHEGKVKMYMKCTKKELIEMLIQSNSLLLFRPMSVELTMTDPRPHKVEIIAG